MIHDNPLFLSHGSLLQDGTKATSAANAMSPAWPGKLLWRQSQSSLLVEPLCLWYCSLLLFGIAWAISQEPSWIPQEILHQGSVHYDKIILSFSMDLLDLNINPGIIEILWRKWFNNSLQDHCCQCQGLLLKFRCSLFIFTASRRGFCGHFLERSSCEMLLLCCNSTLLAGAGGSVS